MKRAILYIAKSTLAIVLSLGLTGFVLVPLKSQAALNKRIFLTASGTWTVPADWNSSANTIETIGGGGDGGSYAGNGGGGGAYAKISNLTLTPGASVTYKVGFGVDTLLNSTTVYCTGSPAPSVCATTGVGGQFGGSGGDTVNSIGTTKYAGGNGSGGAGGGGGAAGPNGAGGSASGTTGGTGDNGFGGTGGTQPGSGCFGSDGDVGGAGVEYDEIPGHGSGGGGGAGDPEAFGGDGGAYGGGGGGGGADCGSGGGFGGIGAAGLIIITYTSTEVPSSSYAQFKILGWSVRIIGGRVVIK